MAGGNRVSFIDGVRSPFGRAGEKGVFWTTRADDIMAKTVVGLLERNSNVPPEAIDEVALAAATQAGDQGLVLGRSVGILAGLPLSVPGFAIDRWCAGAMTAATTVAGGIAMGAYDIAIAGGVEHMGHHPIGAGLEPNPRFISEKLVDPAALSMGETAERLHDRFPQLTKERSDRFAVASQAKAEAAYQAGQIQADLVPVSASGATGWTVVDTDETRRPGTNMEGLADLKTPFRPHGRVTAGNASGLTDGATACILASDDAVAKYGLTPKMYLVSYAFVGVEPEVMGIGPIPSTEKALAKAGLTMDDIGLIEINEAFAVQVLSFTDHFGLPDDDPRVNPMGGAIAFGHPLASSGVRLMIQLAREFAEHPEVRYGMTTMCVGLGQGGTVIWENPNWKK
jgi:acetyl-CoA acyltransferase